MAASFDDLLKAMSPVNSGDSVFEVSSSSRINAMQEAIRMLIMGENIMEGPNVRKDSSQGKLILSADSSGIGSNRVNNFPFKLSLTKRADDPALWAVKITDGKVNNEWPDVGPDAMGLTGSRMLNIANIENANIFIRVMFNAKTNEIVRSDIYERPNETFPVDKITFLPLDQDPVPGACDAVDNPNDAPPAGYGAIHILLGFTYVQPATPPATPIPIVFQSEGGNIKFELVSGSKNGLPTVLAIKTYSKWTKVPLHA